MDLFIFFSVLSFQNSKKKKTWLYNCPFEREKTFISHPYNNKLKSLVYSIIFQNEFIIYTYEYRQYV